MGDRLRGAQQDTNHIRVSSFWVRDLVHELGKATWFTELDSQKESYQVQAAEEAEWKTAFKRRFESLQFNVTPPSGLARARRRFKD